MNLMHGSFPLKIPMSLRSNLIHMVVVLLFKLFQIKLMKSYYAKPIVFFSIGLNHCVMCIKTHSNHYNSQWFSLFEIYVNYTGSSTGTIPSHNWAYAYVASVMN
eukprot:52752_1